MIKTLIFFMALCGLSQVSLAEAEKTAVLKSILKDSYDVFVKKLGENIHDEKFLMALRAGDKNLDKIDFELNAVYAVKDLIPTQNEIDVDKSLFYPLAKESVETLKKYLNATSNDVFSPGGVIVVAGGKYIIDGHHRWSQLYLINPRAKIRAINMKIDDPNEALKVTQLAIGAIVRKIPSAVVQGKNILKMSKEELRNWVIEKVGDNAMVAFKEFLPQFKTPAGAHLNIKNAIADYIWQNTELMQTHNKPIESAPHRGIMPQTDQAQGWLDLLRDGLIDVR